MRKTWVLFFIVSALLYAVVILCFWAHANYKKHFFDSYELTELSKRNPECFGLLFMDSILREPVAKGADNSWYLTHNFDGQSDSGGCIFADTACDENSKNLILYGHNNENGTMFSELLRFRDPDFAAGHRDIQLTLKNGELRTYRLAYVLSINTEDPYALVPYQKALPDGFWKDLSNESIYYRSNESDSSGFNSGISSDTLTLSTCDVSRYGAAGRLVLIAVRI